MPNALQLRVRGAAAMPLEIETRFEHSEPKEKLDEYFTGFTPDFETFLAVPWVEPVNARVNRPLIPPTGWNEFYLGMQFTFPSEAVEARFTRSARPPTHVLIDTLGTSMQGRPIRRITITDTKSPFPRAFRRHHYLVNQHPGESIARWRIAGMIGWLLSDDPADGIDMNRCFRPEGSDSREQTREAWLFQN